MTFRDFMDASYALMAEERQRIDPLRSLLDISEQVVPRPEPTPARKQASSADNEASLNVLTAAMSNVRGKAPLIGKGKRRPRV